MDERAANGLSDMLEAHREYATAQVAWRRSLLPFLLGIGLVAAVVAAAGCLATCGEMTIVGSLVVIGVAMVGLLVLLTSHTKADERRVAAKARLDAILDEKLAKIAGGMI